MSTKSRTKKPAAKPQRYVRVAVKAGKATLQESDHPNRGFKPPRQPKPTAEDIGRSIGDALGRRLESLLAKPGNLSFDAVSAWTVEKLGDGVTGYRANHATETVPARISPVGEALATLRNAVTHAEVITDRETEHLQSARVLAPSPDNPGVGSCETVWTPSLASDLQALAERIHADNYRRANMLDRLEL